MKKSNNVLRLCLKAAALAALSLPVVAWALPCQPEWHNDVTFKEGALNLDDGHHSFKIKPDGQLYFGIHLVQLNVQQQQALANYHQTLSQDLPYLLSYSQLMDDEVCQRIANRQVLETEIQSLIPALKNWQTVTLD